MQNKITRLDLGGTACYASPDAVGITLDGTMSDQEFDDDHNPIYPTPYIIGDYNLAPFPTAAFDEAFGCCYLEERVDWFELRRLVKSGAKVIVSSCDEWTPTDDSFWEFLTQTLKDSREAGFELVSLEPRDAGIDGNIAMPTVTLIAN